MKKESKLEILEDRLEKLEGYVEYCNKGMEYHYNKVIDLVEEQNKKIVELEDRLNKFLKK